jgi:hypothetical protein
VYKGKKQINMIKGRREGEKERMEDNITDAFLLTAQKLYAYFKLMT